MTTSFCLRVGTLKHLARVLVSSFLIATLAARATVEPGMAQPATPSNTLLQQYLADYAHFGFNQATQNLAYNAGQFFNGGTVVSVLGTGRFVSGTTDTLLATDCGKIIFYTSSSPVTVTIPAAIVLASPTTCVIAITQSGTAKVSVNGSAVSAASLVSANSYTGTSGTSGAIIDLVLISVSGTATAYLTGTGS